MKDIIGRQSEISILKDALTSQSAELIAVYGRLRVGKTHLIRTVYDKNIIFEFTGANGAAVSEQLENFTSNIQTSFQLNYTVPLAVPENWSQAFRLLINILESKLNSKKKVVFFDEFPWLDGKKAGFLAAFDHFWNNWASKQKNLVVVICGSSASWMIQNVVRNKGCLHNRIIQKIRLQPFTLHETELFLKNKFINLSRYDILQLYMVTGGIPHYLKNILVGESTAQTIDRLCFTKDGGLKNEFKDLYPALFGKADKHIAVIRALAEKLSGLTRNEIITVCQFKSGGTVTKILEDLEESSFITGYIPFGKNAKEVIFKLTDEYSLFYLKFIENSKSTGTGTWQTKSTGQAWKSWCGFAFVNICLKHILEIKKALGIAGIYSEQSVWRYTPKLGETGAQIDLLIDRQDNCINLLELKFYNTKYNLDKNDVEDLLTKRQVFVERTGTKKTIFITLLTTFGANLNDHYLQIIQNQLTMDVLFVD